MTTKSNDRSRQMFDLVKRAQESELSKQKFCEQHGIAPQTFYYWQKKYREQNSDSSEGFVPLTFNKTKQVPPAFIEIMYPNGTTLRMEGQPDADFIHQLIKI